MLRGRVYCSQTRHVEDAQAASKVAGRHLRSAGGGAAAVAAAEDGVLTKRAALQRVWQPQLCRCLQLAMVKLVYGEGTVVVWVLPNHHKGRTLRDPFDIEGGIEEALLDVLKNLLPTKALRCVIAARSRIRGKQILK